MKRLRDLLEDNAFPVIVALAIASMFTVSVTFRESSMRCAHWETSILLQDEHGNVIPVTTCTRWERATEQSTDTGAKDGGK